MIQKPTQKQIDNLISIALNEDIGPGDITTRSIVSEDQIFEAEILALNDMILCGLNIFKSVFYRLDTNVCFSEVSFDDGDKVLSGSSILRLKGNGIALLEGERVALNLLQRLCGIATFTHDYVRCAGPIEVFDTRKTIPGLRVFEKYAVLCGGGKNHRFGLYDAILIKDNHIKAAGGIVNAVEKVRKHNKTTIPIEVETTSIDEVHDAIKAKCSTIMLDNMSLQNIKDAVKLISGRAIIEVSGKISLKNIGELSNIGVDCVSIGALTHSSKASDISMNFIVR